MALHSSSVKSLEDFNQEYLEVHSKKEDLFWATYMGVEQDHSKLEKAESEYKTYICNPKRLPEARESLAHESSPNRKKALEGWIRFFSTHTLENPLARKIQSEIIELETAIYKRRSQLKLTYQNEKGEQVEGSSNVMTAHITANENESVRQSAHKALLHLECWVLENGFIDLIKKRNEFARTLGHKNYFDYRVQLNEGLTHDQLFTIFDEFETLTKNVCFEHLKQLSREKGQDAILGHNIKFATAGDAEKQLDPYMPFGDSLRRWSLSFSRLGIGYRGATLQLDLIDRKGKYENGFMHGPGPCFFDQGTWRPARINFTSNAAPKQIGSGRRALITLFHEGGHAAHFSNILQSAPCFSQEYPPTSMAFAETQSMFCDSLIQDADWMKLYARNIHDEPIPDELIRFFITSDHPFRAFQERSILVVPIFESQLYSLPENELKPDRILALARQCEKEVLGIPCSPRPLLAIPHLLGAESACSYQGYLLAHMAVYQTRQHFLKKHGYLTDQPQIGPEIAKAYWHPGNSIRHTDAVKQLTGSSLSGRALAEHCNLDNKTLWKHSAEQIQKALKRPVPPTPSVNLDATIRIVHGTEEICSNLESPPSQQSLKSMEKMWQDFQNWIHRHSNA